MHVYPLEKEQFVELGTQSGDHVVIYNLTPAQPITITSGVNGLYHFSLASRSGLGLQADSNLTARCEHEGGLVGVEILRAQPNEPPVTQPIYQLLKGKKFYLDPGHGGKDPGAVNSFLGLEEKVAALEIAVLLGQLLQASGAEVKASRNENWSYPELSQRASEANVWGADVVVSIHLNSAENKTAEGIETLVYALSGQAYELAKAVQENMVKATGFKDRGVKARPDLTVLKKTKMPAILCEVGFISNDEEAKKLFSVEYQRLLAQAIYQGILEKYKD